MLPSILVAVEVPKSERGHQKNCYITDWVRETDFANLQLSRGLYHKNKRCKDHISDFSYEFKQQFRNIAASGV